MHPILNKRIRNKKGNLLIYEFVGLIPLFFILMMVMLDFLGLYSIAINMQLAAQSAMSEIAFMGQDGKEDEVMQNAVKKANSIISFAHDKNPNGDAHKDYDYYLIRYEVSDNPLFNKEINHTNVQNEFDKIFMDTTGDRYKDHRGEIWGFRIDKEYKIRGMSWFNYNYTFDMTTTQYMGILKGNPK